MHGTGIGTLSWFLHSYSLCVFFNILCTCFTSVVYFSKIYHMFLNFCSFNLFRPSLSSSYFSQTFKCFLPLSTLSYFSQLFYTVQPFSLLHLFKWFYFFVCFAMLFLQFSMFWTTRVCIFWFFPHVSKVFDVFPFIIFFCMFSPFWPV